MNSIRRNVKIMVLLGILAVAAYGHSYIKSTGGHINRKTLADFPATIGGWTTVREYPIDSRTMEVLQADDYLVRDYCNAEKEAINVYIGYFISQREGKTIHSPRQCLPGSGWFPLKSDTMEIFQPDHSGRGFIVNRLMMAKGQEYRLYLFWYQGRGRAYANEYLNKLYLIWDAVTKRRTDGALIRISSSANISPDRSQRVQQAFIKELVPVIRAYVPD